MIPNTWRQTLPGAWGSSDRWPAIFTLFKHSLASFCPWIQHESTPDLQNPLSVAGKQVCSPHCCDGTKVEQIWVLVHLLCILQPQATAASFHTLFLSSAVTLTFWTHESMRLWVGSAEVGGVPVSWHQFLTVCLGWEAGRDIWVMDVSTGDNLFFSLNFILWLIWSSSTFLSRTCGCQERGQRHKCSQEPWWRSHYQSVQEKSWQQTAWNQINEGVT